MISKWNTSVSHKQAEEIFHKWKLPVTAILADHYNEIARSSEDDHASGLMAEVLFLDVYRVLRNNLWTNEGLV